MKKQKFWQKGVRFECQGSGKCCLSRGEYGFVYLTDQDSRRMARHLKLSKKDFLQKYGQQTDGHWHLRHPEKDCEFLKMGRCSVYAARPVQCRTWPFWPENMQAKTWNQEITPFCAGVGKGKIVSPETIQKNLDQMEF